MRTITRAALAGTVAIAFPLAGASGAFAHSDHAGDDSGDMTGGSGYTELWGELGELNNSGGSGSVWGSVDGNTLDISVEVDGLLDGSPHAQHIHIGGQNNCPSPDATGNGQDGSLQVSDAIGNYGDIFVTLTNEGGTAPENGLDVDDFPTDGSYTYSRTIEVSDQVAADLSAGLGVVVVHGNDYDGSGAYDSEVVSDLDPNLPTEATDPALCGVVEVADMTPPEGPIDTGGAGTSGMEYAGVLGLGAAAIAAGGIGLAVSRRRANDA